MSGVEVIITADQDNNPSCLHGPTLLFSREVAGNTKKFFACSACRDRKECTFFLWEDERKSFETNKKKSLLVQIQKNLKTVNHRKSFIKLHKIKAIPPDLRIYCALCNEFVFSENLGKHIEHKLLNGISDFQLANPSQILPHLDNTKKEAQFLFGESTVKFVIDMVKKLKKRIVICIGTPRIHEYIFNNPDSGLNSILLDLDKRFHHFFGPLEFCWYNSFNNHFFFEESKEIFLGFLKSCRLDDTILITDPPFGGRIEPLAYSFKQINNQFKMLNDTKKDLDIFWFFPYFMESLMLNSLPNFNMLDYKVEYDNHVSFQNGKKGRKYGSPVRIFTNIAPSLITLPEEEGYKYCGKCKKWVSRENRHCDFCKNCTSKDGRTYVHCKLCKKCVKPTWQHCEKCRRCTLPDHKCGELVFSKSCFHCHQAGHKKRECPKVNHEEIRRKRKAGEKVKKTKRGKKTKI